MRFKEKLSGLNPFFRFENYRDEKIIFYARIYTYLTIASRDFHHREIKPCLFNLTVAKKFASECRIKDENKHAQQIKNICDILMKDIKDVRKNQYKSEHHKLKVLFRNAQGICILRMLRS